MSKKYLLTKDYGLWPKGSVLDVTDSSNKLSSSVLSWEGTSLKLFVDDYMVKILLAIDGLFIDHPTTINEGEKDG